MAEKIKQNSDIQSELIKIVYSATPQSLVGILVCSLTLAVIQWDYIAHTTIIAWVGTANGLSLVRLLAYKKFNRDSNDDVVAAGWGRFALLSSIASGATWGAAAIWMFPLDDVAHQALLAFVVAGMCAGAVTTLSPMLSSLVVFIMLAIVPAIIRFLSMGTEVSYAMAFTAIFFAAILMKTAKNLNQTIKESLLIRHEQRLTDEVIEHQALYDSLTDLPNRRLLVDKITHEIARAIRQKYISAVLFLDLDYFKNINDSMGHAFGDELLKSVADRLRNNLRDEDTIARIGGDEFVILISNIGGDNDDANSNLKIFTDKIMCLFEKDFDVRGQNIFITASMGMSTFPLKDTTPDELLQRSDVAMYEAKEAGRNKIRLFAPKMQQKIIEQREVERGLRKALKEGELELYYQPLFDDSSDMFAVEALIRWNHPEKGLVPPIDFIEIAEKCGLIVQIGDWVLEQACKSLVQISDYKDITMSINVSPRQFGETSFVTKLLNILSKTGVDPKKITLEITESMIMDNIEDTIERMNVLATEGISFSIDDFGTGYSSLAYLKRLPVDILKIDKSFILDVTNDNNDAVIVETILAMAHHMNIDVIAEGVETTQVLSFLKEKGCHKFQGYLFARPMPFEKIVKLARSDGSAQLLKTVS